MVAEARLKSKNLYKVELYLLKIMPMVIALAYLVNTVSSYFGVDIPILASIAGMSLIPLIFMYISSYVSKFCEYHRMFLHYIAVNDIINIYDCRPVIYQRDGEIMGRITLIALNSIML